MNTFTTHMFLISITILSMVYLSQPYRHSRHLVRRYHRETFYLPSSTLSFFPPSSHPRPFYSSPLSLSFPPFPSFPGRGFPAFPSPRRLPVLLFTPNTIEQPAETKGQIEEYMKDLEEKAKEAEQEGENGIDEVGFGGDEGEAGRNFVSVRSSHYNYSYFN